MADHEDYLSGEAPMAHHESHESLGSDEINVAGLHGVTAELAIHAALPTVHQDAPALIAAHQAIAAAHHVRYSDAEVTAIANGLIAAHTAIAAAHHARYTDAEAEAVADTQIATHAALPTVHQDAPALIATHAALPTVHQDAPALIATHAALPAAHHAKYTDAEARAAHNPLAISLSTFFPGSATYDWTIDEYKLRNAAALTVQYFYAPVILPHGSTVTKLTLYGYRDDAASSLVLILFRTDRVTTRIIMAMITAAWTDGYNDSYDATITSPLIDNDNYTYVLRLALDPNDAVGDVMLTGVKIEFTG